MRRRRVNRVATISMHTSPLDQPGTGDAGGMNVYIVECAKRLARLGVEVEIFTRATARDLPPVAELAPGVLVRHLTAGPYEEMDRAELPGQLCAFLSEVLRTEAMYDPGRYDVIHSHYWLSGQVGWLAKERWGVPLVHTMHTMAKVKNLLLARGDKPEPAARVIGEQQVVDVADRLVANTADEAGELIDLYGADPARVAVVNPGVNLNVFTPASQGVARHRLGLPQDAHVLLFVGRIQPLKAPRRAAARRLQDAHRRARTARAPGDRLRRRPVGQRPGQALVPHRTRHRAGHRRRRPARAAGAPGGAGRLVPGRHGHRRAVVQRVVRPGRP
ncbi:hypothetical protein GCM10020001_055570 [Nonomuraea salmonea]